MRRQKIIFACFSVLLGYGSMSQAWADEPAWWTQQKRACGLPPGLAYNSWNGVCGGRTNTPPPPVINYEEIRLKEQTNRYYDLLHDMHNFSVPDIRSLYGAGPPESLNELTRRIDLLYVESAFHKSRSYWRYEKNLKELTEFPSVITGFRADIAKLEEQLVTAPERLKNAEAARDRQVARAKSAESVAWNLRNNAAFVEMDLWTARAGPMWSIYKLLPEDRKDAFHAEMKKADTFSVYARDKLPEAVPVARAQPRAAHVVASTGDYIGKHLGPQHKPSPVAGSVEVKLQAFNDLKEVLGYISPLMPSQEKRLKAYREQTADMRTHYDSVYARLQAYESPLEKAQVLADDAEKRFLAAQVNQKISATTLLRLAAATIVWDHVKNKVVVPNIERVLRANGLLKGVRGVALLDKIQNRPQDFLPTVGPLKDLSRLIETGKKVLAVEESMESFALAAAEANAQRDTAASESLSKHLFMSLGKQGTDIMRTASGEMEGPMGKIAQTLMERAPKK